MSKYKPDDIITPVEASKESEIAYLTISRAIKAGKIPSKKEKNIISLVFKDFEKWWREYQDEQNLIAEKINKSRELLEKLNGNNESYYGSAISKCVKQHEINSSYEPKNEFSHIVKHIELSEFSHFSLELLPLFNAANPISLQITVINSKNETRYIDICNITVMGDPQLLNFNGVTDFSMRGTSLYFEKEKDVSNFSIFGSSRGQGLFFDLYNPFNEKLKVHFVLKIKDAPNNEIGCKDSFGRFLFAKRVCDANSVKKIKILAGRSGAFKIRQLQINSFYENDIIQTANLEIENISICRVQQFGYLCEKHSLCSNYFSESKNVNFNVFGCGVGNHTKIDDEEDINALEFIMRNETNCNIVTYFTLFGDVASTDLIGK